ncbi:MAG TPA: hypothetical protein PK175_11115 [Syntrophales bacterium]|nr:hypothetical protein [Syntrophales bacterium]HQG35415.1 hypothetical protein [Syntrophales bacterium]HQJ31178.1 hypothetical protein [Syntrophales bacterium]
MIHHCPSLGLVSRKAPLLSNLSVLENIALINQYHHGFSRQKAEETAREYLRRLDLESLAGKRNPQLLEEQRFGVLVLRAAMIEDSLLVLDRPFQMMPALGDSGFIYNVIASVTDRFRECHILDYSLNAGRYAGRIET